MLEIRDLRAGYGSLEVLRGVDLSVAADIPVAVLGANGAGKTTLCRVISGLIPLRAGRILFDRAEINGWSTVERVRKGIVQVPEGRQIFADMTVHENLRLGAFVHGEPKPSALDWVFDLFPILRDRRDQRAGLMSGGEQQMLAIGRAMMAAPRLLILDEPSQGLAPKAVQHVGDAVNAIARSGVAILIVEQNLTLARQIAQHAYVLETGAFVTDGPAREIMEGQAVAASYLGSSAH
jgi:branched-chain amino acid transport system ATP-binding protein